MTDYLHTFLFYEKIVNKEYIGHLFCVFSYILLILIFQIEFEYPT